LRESYPNEDLLGYKLFAESLSESIAKVDASEGLVIALYGLWGSVSNATEAARS